MPLLAWRWWRDGGRGAWFGLLFAAIFAPWFHLTVLPAVGAPLALLVVLSASRVRARWRPLIGLLVAVAVGWVLLLGPPLCANPGGFSQKSGRGAVTAETWIPALQLFVGTAQPIALGLWGLAAIFGAFFFARGERLGAAFAGTSIVAQVAGLAVANPFALEYPMPMVRYALPLLPWALLAVACTLNRLDGLASVARIPSGLATLVAVAALAFVGPLPTTHFRPNAFTNHNLYQQHYEQSEFDRYAAFLRRDKPWPAFYDELASMPPRSVTIVEAPWYYPWVRIFFNLAQERHRQHVLIGFVGRNPEPIAGEELPLGERYAFRNFMDVRDIDALAERGVDYVVFHRRLKGELRTSFELPRIQAAVDRIADYRERLGEPHYEDRDVVVFRLNAP